MVEYAIMMALVALVSVGVVGNLGFEAEESFERIDVALNGSEVGGDSSARDAVEGGGTGESNEHIPSPSPPPPPEYPGGYTGP